MKAQRNIFLTTELSFKIDGNFMLEHHFVILSSSTNNNPYVQLYHIIEFDFVLITIAKYIIDMFKTNICET